MDVSVLVLMGGPDAERAVSIESGKEVARALREVGRFEVVEELIDSPDLEELRNLSGDIVFPALHGHWGEGGPLQEMLETLGRAYVGSGPTAAELAMDKLATKKVVAAHGVLTPEAIELAADSNCPLDLPLVLKPIDDGSSVDIAICTTQDELDKARKLLHPRRGRLMAEQYIQGREITVGVVNGQLLPQVEIIPSTDFYDYDAKYKREDTHYVVNPDLPLAVSEQCMADTQAAWDVIGCRDIARADYMLDEQGKLWFLEINTMPGFTAHSLIPMAARHTGMEMPELCALLVDSASTRAEMRHKETVVIHP